MHAKDLDEPKYQLLIKKRENTGIKNLDGDASAFIEYSNNMDDGYDNIDDYNPKKKKRKVLTVFDDMVAHVTSNKKAYYLLKELLLDVGN